MPHHESYERGAKGPSYAGQVSEAMLCQVLLWMELQILELQEIAGARGRPMIMDLEVFGARQGDTMLIALIAVAAWSDGFKGFDTDRHPQPADWDVAFADVGGGTVEKTGPDTCNFTPADETSDTVNALYGQVGGDIVITEPAPTITGLVVNQVPATPADPPA